MSGSCIRCRSYAINPRLHGRDDTDLDLCDVCYWRARAESNDTLRAQLEAAEAEMEALKHDVKQYMDSTVAENARAEAAEAESARCLTAMRRAVLALAHVSKDDPLYTDSYEVLSDAIAARTKEAAP